MTSRWLSILLLFTWVAGFAATSPAQKVPPERSSSDRVREPRLKLRTNAFSDGSRLPAKYTCWVADDEIVSPPFQWSYVPNGAKSFALILTGPENIRRTLHPDYYWVLWNIPGSATSIPEDIPQGAELPDGSRQAKSEEIVGYNPPCTPLGVGELHQEFKLFALDAMLTLPSSATADEVVQALDGHVLGASVYYSTTERTSK